MKGKNITIKLIQLLTLIILYYIAGNNSLFLYASTLSLYNIYTSCFEHISLKETFKKLNYDYSKFKIFKYITINIIIIYTIFILLSILISDAMNMFLNIENTFLPYLMMSLSVITEPLLKIILEYLESYNKPKLSSNLFKLYYISETILLILIGIITINIIKLPISVSLSLLYLSKIISFIILAVITYLTLKKQNIKLNKTREEKKINYKKEITEILKNNSHKSVINLVKNSYYYISIIILYAVLLTRYSYNIKVIENDLTFIYLYGINIVSSIKDIILMMTKNITKKDNVVNYIYKVFQNVLTIAIILGITSPLICKIIFNSDKNFIYLMMLSILLVFNSLFDTTYEYVKSKKVIYLSLIASVIIKLILVIPLINSFYRMGYNLIYGDIISTIIALSFVIIINYICIKLKNKSERTLENILVTLYESILLCIILVLIQFIVPIKTDSYIKSLFTLALYIFISVMFIKMKEKKRG